MEQASSSESYEIPTRRINSNLKNVKFSTLRKARHSVGNCEKLFEQKEKPILTKSKSLLNDLYHLETTSNGLMNGNYKINNKPVEPIITFPDEPQTSSTEIVPKKPLKTILKNRLPSPTLPSTFSQPSQLRFSNFSNFTITRETEVSFPDDRTRTFTQQNLGTKGKFLDSLNCDASCSSSFSSNFDHAYLHKPKSKYLIEPRRRWSYDYVKREPSDILNPDLDSPYLITEEKLLKTSTTIIENDPSIIFSTFTTLAQFVYVCATNLKYLVIFYLAAACCLLAFSIKFLTYFLNLFKHISLLLVYPFYLFILGPVLQTIAKKINDKRMFKKLNSSNSLTSDVSNGFLPLISEEIASSTFDSTLNNDKIF